MNAAPCSWRVKINLIDELRRLSTTSRFSSPGTPKMRSTPSFSSAATSKSDPFGIAVLPIVPFDQPHRHGDRASDPVAIFRERHSLHPVLPSPEARLAPFEERRHALLVVLGQAGECKLVDVHVAGEVVERMRQAIDG